MNAEPHLLGVRFRASDGVLARIEDAARRAGWTEVRHDRVGTLLVLAPDPYSIERFRRLIDEMETVGTRDFGLQLIGQDGRAVDEDGNPVNEN